MKQAGKILAICTLLVFASVTLFAEAQAETKAAASQAKTTVQFWHSMSGANGEFIATMAKKFNETHPNIEVVPTFQGGYWEAASKAMAAVSAGQNPDILMMGADHVSIFAKEEGVLADLLPYMKKTGVDPKDFIEAFSWDYQIDNKMIAMPFGRSTPVLFVNMDMLNAEGLKVPTTWDELEKVSNALVKKQGAEVTRYGFSMPYDTWYFFMAVAAAGGKFINDEKTGMGCIEDGSALRAYTFYQKLKNSNAMFFGPTIDSNTVCRQLFLDGKAGMFLTSIGNLGFINDNAKFKYQVAWVPAGKQRVVPTGGNSVVIMEKSRAKDAAWAFLDWCIKDPNGSLFFTQKTGYFPITFSMAKSDVVQKSWAENPNRKIAFEQLQFASDKGHRVPQVGSIMNELFVFIEAIMYDNKDVKKQLDILAKSVADIMKE